MHGHELIILGALVVLVFGLFSLLAERSPITGPMVFVTIGYLVSPLGFGWIEVSIKADVVKVLAELTLIIILFVDASLINFRGFRETLSGIPARLLGIGLPLSMLLGTCIAYLLFPSWSWWLLAMMAMILTPTDAALGQAVIKSPKVPERIRESISIESGLNDGIALPPILMCIAVLGAANADAGDGHWLKFMALQLTLGPLLGALVGYVGSKLVEYATQKDWMAPVFQQLTAFSIAILSFVIAESVHGNGFIAAFFAGLFFNISTPNVQHRVEEFGEALGQLFSLYIFLLLGVAAIPFAIVYWDMNVVVYALLSLTLIRMLPGWISLTGSGLDNYTKLFVTWFGPRGIASVLYLLIALGTLGVEGYETAFSVIILTVILSTFAHGLTAVSMSNRFENK